MTRVDAMVPLYLPWFAAAWIQSSSCACLMLLGVQCLPWLRGASVAWGLAALRWLLLLAVAAPAAPVRRCGRDGLPCLLRWCRSWGLVVVLCMYSFSLAAGCFRRLGLLVGAAGILERWRLGRGARRAVGGPSPVWLSGAAWWLQWLAYQADPCLGSLAGCVVHPGA